MSFPFRDRFGEFIAEYASHVKILPIAEPSTRSLARERGARTDLEKSAESCCCKILLSRRSFIVGGNPNRDTSKVLPGKGAQLNQHKQYQKPTPAELRDHVPVNLLQLKNVNRPRLFCSPNKRKCGRLPAVFHREGQAPLVSRGNRKGSQKLRSYRAQA